MDGITIRSEMGNEAQVIHTYTGYSDIDTIILAQRSDSGVKLSTLSLAHKSRTIYLPSEAMAALMTLWGGTAQRSETGDLGMLRDAYGDKCEAYEALNERWKDTNAETERRLMRAQGELESAREEIAALEQVIATGSGYTQHEWQVLHDTESAEIERLRGVVKQQREQIDEMESRLDPWQSEVEELRDLRDANALTIGNLRGQLDRMQSQESFRMALLESVASAAVLAAHEFQYGGESEAKAARDALLVTIDALDRHADQPDDASTDVSTTLCECGLPLGHSDDAFQAASGTWPTEPHKPMPVAPGVCPECGQVGGHDLHCKNDDEGWEENSNLTDRELLQLTGE